MNFSEHAIRRGQQRGIKSCHMELLAKHGQRRRCIGGAYAYTLNKRGLARLKSMGIDTQALDKLRYQVLIGSPDGNIITAYHRD
jgi:hypothetical protein